MGTLARKPVILYEIKKDRCLLRFVSREKKNVSFCGSAGKFGSSVNTVGTYPAAVSAFMEAC